jgi:RNA polymerase sigma-70 factor (ECF subfamily)
MTFERYFRSQLLHEMPLLRRWSHVLCRNQSLAEDMMQETLTRAWANRASFARGTNMRAWLYRILRNTYFNHLRQRRREVSDPDGALTAALTVSPAQPGRVELREVTRAMQDLSPTQRQAMILIGAQGLSYKQVARLQRVNIGTVKSRLARARQSMARMMGYDSAGLRGGSFRH